MKMYLKKSIFWESLFFNGTYRIGVKRTDCQYLSKLPDSRCIENLNEIDEYFTDIDSNFIKNRTCLRIRKNNNDNMEITYKGKSDSLLGCFCKLENNISVSKKDYNNIW